MKDVTHEEFWASVKRSAEEVRQWSEWKKNTTLVSLTINNSRPVREERLKALGFEEPTAEQRKKNLELNIALRDWPKD